MKYTITLDEGVPMPGPDREDPRLAQIREMNVGDSFFVKGAQRGDFRSLLYLGRQHNILLVTEYQKHDPIYLEEGVRVWRVEKLPERKYGKTSKKAKPKPETTTHLHEGGEQDDDL